MSKRAEKLAYTVPHAALPKAEVHVGSPPAPRATQKRWPMAFSILGAVSVSLALWAGLGWIVLAFVSLFD